MSLDLQIRALINQNHALRSMLAMDPCIHKQIEQARLAVAEGRTCTLEELDASLALTDGD